MAMLDVSDILLDPELTDLVTLIHRQSNVNGHGENELTETVVPNVRMCVQGAGPEALERVPDAARLSDLITVYYRGELTAESPGGYCDVIMWRGRRYQVKVIPSNYMNFGAGYTMADCLLEAANA